MLDDNPKMDTGDTGSRRRYLLIFSFLLAGAIIGITATYVLMTQPVTLDGKSACCMKMSTVDGERIPVCAWTPGARKHGCKKILGDDWSRCRVTRWRCNNRCNQCASST